MEMKKCLVVVALLVGAFSAQGAQLYWTAAIDDDFSKSGNWLSNDFSSVSAVVPGLDDTAEIHSGVTAITPVISTSIPVVGTVHVGSNSPTGTLSVVEGGSINSVGILRVGQAAVGTLTMTGGYIVGDQLRVGDNGGTGTINMSGASVLHFVSANFELGLGGVMSMADNARLVVNSATTNDAASWIANGFIVAANAGAGETIVYTNTGDNITFSVLPFAPIPDIGDITLEWLAGTNALALTWATGDGFGYAVESKTSLLDENWTTNTTGIVGTGGDVTVTTAVDQAQSFYRVVGE
ncbi:MAG: hypothetical protein DRP64_01415 [Verrucomicrobia bacterium]|nr:MAG: hypothetical protein DRP64_01415 [Verrucomicrobiota bacterium]